MSLTNSLLNLRRRETSTSVPAAEAFFQSIASRLRARMVNRTSSDIPIRVSGVAVRPLGDLFDEPELREGGISGPLWVGPARLPGVVLMQHELLARLIAVLLGEEMGDKDAPAQLRSLSPVERRIAGRLCADLLSETATAWPDSSPPHIQMGTLGPSARPRDASVSTVPVYSATFDLGPVDSPLGLLTLGLPLHALSALEDEESDEAPPPPVRGPDLSRVMPVEVDVVVELTSLRLTVNTLRNLEVGDVVPLGAMRSALVRVNGLPLFEGQAGAANGARSIKITRRIPR